MQPAPAPPSRLFLILTFGSAIVVAVLIAYFGLNGQLGAGIP